MTIKGLFSVPHKKLFHTNEKDNQVEEIYMKKYIYMKNIHEEYIYMKNKYT